MFQNRGKWCVLAATNVFFCVNGKYLNREAEPCWELWKGIKLNHCSTEQTSPVTAATNSTTLKLMSITGHQVASHKHGSLISTTIKNFTQKFHQGIDQSTSYVDYIGL